jgi:4-amino-4-deoxy-L-arabinose transferase-like glycosyltransferase
MPPANRYRATLIVLFALFLVANGAYLHQVPGLMGDEASEGENVYFLFDAKQLVITGERSYIGPLIDYIRVPFVLLFGYGPLSLRVVTWLFSAATFWLAVIVCRRLWGESVGLMAAVALLFSPIYLTYQRLGWAITLFPFFAFLMLYLLTMPETSRLARAAPLLAGLAAGLSLHNHVLFLSTMVGVAVGWAVAMLAGGRWRRLLRAWPALVGFWAGFGTQFAVMLLNRDDFRDAARATSLYGDRTRELREALPMVLSGSSYVARYTGDEFSPFAIKLITWIIFGLAIAALIVPRSWRISSAKALRVKGANPGKFHLGASWVWLIGVAVVMTTLLYMIFQFSLRYFVAPVLGFWALAGAGLGAILALLLRDRFRVWLPVLSLGLAVALTAWTFGVVLAPFLQSGGSTGEYSIGKRSDRAAALVDTRPLLTCVKGDGPVYSKDVHIQNRLRYLSYNPRNSLEVVAENEPKTRAVWIVSYRLEGEENPHAPFEKCPELTHWKVIARDRG